MNIAGLLCPREEKEKRKNKTLLTVWFKHPILGKSAEGS